MLDRVNGESVECRTSASPPLIWGIQTAVWTWLLDCGYSQQFGRKLQVRTDAPGQRAVRVNSNDADGESTGQCSSDRCNDVSCDLDSDASALLDVLARRLR